MTGRHSVYDQKNESISLGEEVYMTGIRSVYDWNNDCISLEENRILLEEGLYITGKRSV